MHSVIWMEIHVYIAMPVTVDCIQGTCNVTHELKELTPERFNKPTAHHFHTAFMIFYYTEYIYF